jgi:hypothetical protein
MDLRASPEALRCEGLSRRGALCAPAWSRHPNAQVFSFHPMTTPEARGLPGTCLGQPHAFPAGVRSPPLRGEQAEARGLSGKTRG